MRGAGRGAQRCDGPGEVHGVWRRQEAQPARQRVLHVYGGRVLALQRRRRVRGVHQCSQCGDGYRLEGDTCVSTGGGSNLSSGAIAGISVAAVVVVGGLVGFLCWWFVCRGKA